MQTTHDDDLVTITIKVPRWKLGRPTDRPADLDSTMSAKAIMETYGVSRATAYRWKAKAGDHHG